MIAGILLFFGLVSTLTADISGSLQITGVHDFSKPTERSFHVNDKAIRPVFTLDYNEEWRNFDFDVRLSNKLWDTYLERLSVVYMNRTNDHIYGAEVGTVETFQGVFSESYLATEQSPFIFKNHGMYNDEFLAGWLDSTLGVQLTYQYMQDCKYLYSIQFTYSRARQLSEDRAEGAFYGYNSDYLDLDFSEWIKSVDFSFEYMNTLKVFGNVVSMSVKAKPDDLGSRDQRVQYGQYLSSGGDKSVFIPNTPYNVFVERGGFIYEDINLLFSVEGFRMHIENTDLSTDYLTYGSAIYLASYITDHLTAYVSYGESTNTKTPRRYEDKIIGVRYTFTDDITVIAEVKESSWIQHKTFQEHSAYLDQDDRDIGTASLQVIYEF